MASGDISLFLKHDVGRGYCNSKLSDNLRDINDEPHRFTPIQSSAESLQCRQDKVQANRNRCHAERNYIVC